MKAINIKTEPYYFKSILSCDVYKAVNEHFKVKISGYITKEIEKNIRFFKSNDQLAIYAEEEGKEQSFFRGRVYNFKIRETRNTYILTINAESNTAWNGIGHGIAWKGQFRDSGRRRHTQREM